MKEITYLTKLFQERFGNKAEDLLNNLDHSLKTYGLDGINELYRTDMDKRVDLIRNFCDDTNTNFIQIYPLIAEAQRQTLMYNSINEIVKKMRPEDIPV